MTGSTGGSFYNAFMRFWVLVFLMVLIPLQVSAAAVGQYRQHETVAPVAHWGHHTHQHKTSTQADLHAEIGKAVVADLDCGACHAGCAMAIPGNVGSVHIETSPTFSASAYLPPGPAPMDVPDRPQWRGRA